MRALFFEFQKQPRALAALDFAFPGFKAPGTKLWVAKP